MLTVILWKQTCGVTVLSESKKFFRRLQFVYHFSESDFEGSESQKKGKRRKLFEVFVVVYRTILLPTRIAKVGLFLINCSDSTNK